MSVASNVLHRLVYGMTFSPGNYSFAVLGKETQQKQTLYCVNETEHLYAFLHIGF